MSQIQLQQDEFEDTDTLLKNQVNPGTFSDT